MAVVYTFTLWLLLIIFKIHESCVNLWRLSQWTKSFCHWPYFLHKSKTQWKNPMGFCQGNFQDGLQKYVIPAPLKQLPIIATWNVIDCLATAPIISTFIAHHPVTKHWYSLGTKGWRSLGFNFPKFHIKCKANPLHSE